MAKHPVGAQFTNEIQLDRIAALTVHKSMHPSELLQKMQADPDFVDLAEIDNLLIELRYASYNNFMQKDIYQEFNRAFLHRIAFEKLRKAVSILAQRHPHWKLKIFDASRPRYVQFAMWAWLENSPKQSYLADPEKGSIHSYGFAVDLSLVDAELKELDMGTPFDEFSPLSEPRNETRCLQQGQLTRSHIENRRLLRDIMTEAGFTQLPIEWWHYDALPAEFVRRNYTTID